MTQTPFATARGDLMPIGPGDLPPGVLVNTRNAQTGAYTVVNTDAGSTIALGGNAFYQLTFNAPSGYSPNFRVIVLNEDTGRAKTIALSGGPTFILWPLQSIVVFNQNNVWQVLGRQRWILPAATTFFVDSVNGSNNNDGLASGAGGAFATIQFAILIVSQFIDLSGQNLTVQLAHGTYAESVILTPYVGRTTQGHSGPVTIQGDAGSPTACIVRPFANTAAFSAVECSSLEWIFQNLQIDCTTNGGGAFLADVSGWIVLNGGITITGTNNSNNHLIAENGGLIEILGNYTITGGGANHWFAHSRGEILTGAPTITLTGTPAFTNFAFCSRNAVMTVPTVTFSGAATGTRFTALTGGGIDSVGGGLNYLPGNVAGTATSPGWYGP